MKMKATELICVLDEMAENGQFVKESVSNGMLRIYKETKQFTDKSVTTAGNIAMMDYATSIEMNGHWTDSETYTVIVGIVLYNGKVYGPGDSIICNKGEAHDCMNLAYGESVLRFVKRK